MSLFELLLTAAGLSMDAFAVAVCKGLAMKRPDPRRAVIVGLYFGGFQALMPLAGYLLGVRFQGAITACDHWIAFLLLSIIGGSMIREAGDPEEERCNDSVAFRDMVPLAVATSIDALAVGVTFAFLRVRILQAAALIGAVALGMSVSGVCAGSAFGTRSKSRAELAGGCILIGIGLKILAEHLFS